MSTRTILQARQDMDSLHKTWEPYVRFQIPFDGLSGLEYMRWLNGRFFEFICSLSTAVLNQIIADRIQFAEAGSNLTLQPIVIGNKVFRGCDLVAYDGTGEAHKSDWKGVVMWDRGNNPEQVVQIYRLAEKFELFLYVRFSAPVYQRFGIRLKTSEEFEQRTAF